MQRLKAPATSPPNFKLLLAAPPHLKHSGSACLLAAGSTPMSWLKGLKGRPMLKLMSRLARLTRSEAKGA